MTTYVDQQLELQWSINTGDVNNQFIYATGSEILPTVDAEYRASISMTASEQSGVETSPGVGTFWNPTFTALADAIISLNLGFTGDYYYRIWVIPDVMFVQNPAINVPIPFHLWNAWPWQNTLESITSIGADGLELSIVPPSLFKAIEYREVDITITPDAPDTISATFDFIFDYGDGPFYFSATIADFVQMVPDPPVNEYWDWLTDVKISYDGTEQRVALRGSPRRSTQFSFPLEGDLERRRQYNRWYKSLAHRIVLPYYQYATALTAAAAIGDIALVFDVSRTDVRDGDYAILLDTADETAHLVKIDTVTGTGCTLSNPLTFAARAGLVFAPSFMSRLENQTGLSMHTMSGVINVSANVLTSREVFSRPGSTAVIPTFDGYSVLDRRPLANNDVPESFDANYEVIDSETGVQDIRASWTHTFVSGQREYLVQRHYNPGEMDFWRDFLFQVRGRQGIFLVPTFRIDLPLWAQPSPGTPQVLVNAPEFSSLYWQYESYKRVQIETGAGIIWRKVVNVTDNPDGSSLLDLDGNFDVTADGAVVNRISFLNVCRLDSDRVTLIHDHHSTVVQLTLRTVDA